ncbi:hypothetical protein A3C20_01940 [Candidatus Kaiserbacteria bacterium RIFCSPHIGHO2_02_FULL_55_25]|uniref:Uncharacterized protein n=1 Tax=Candidatus Kaiserbacteria bacterium RIFCSPHIGHO2_02_FULL_55_25 TaxID=1798498 RepID=A0A1F6E443_9BACT|nr:MAG: hypothetical protein A2764_00205 [Candidatus Kaiserbacteria bacterium RIFCSPHIGHO2_01_FULL_55_79]OGG68474.1 MAG: hypothetical protein A3C20_01940 [Candidatus Kaiserbacteria bacterium RIFCSPHIGHO2_02_FULL_55_25]OGG78412.1 MAG: hypothetical protein A3F56_03220 [Candidatus Kaiserbacteria bacterium RIFCSPHIGHO2_12_FULL_55_13]OGG82758.1 MAG: hypothetical protein A3A42_02745 [Candidatus Kaiserbacteria bacterium RIFCSPLOWO2_01_FULL_55_25]
MDIGTQPSLIPHDAATAAPMPGKRSAGGLAEVGLLISIVLLVASGALGGAVFLYGQYAQTSAGSKVEQLQRAKQAFEPSLIEELTRLDDRMRAAAAILSAHMAPIAFFDALQQSTLQTVSFQTLDLEANDPQHMVVKMNGVAEAVNSIALQADLFSKNGVITNPIFSDISRQQDGVHFALSASVNPTAINYVQLINAASAAQPGQQTQQPAGTLFSPAVQSATQQQPQGALQQPYQPATQTAQ